MTREGQASRLTPKALGLTRIGTGTGPHDWAYAGRGYRIAPITRRCWQLSSVEGVSLATASTCGELLSHLATLLDVGH